MLVPLLSALLISSCQAGLLDLIPGFGSPPPVSNARFSFGNTFVGQWTVTRIDQKMGEGHRENDEELTSLATYNILSENYTTALVGSYLDMDGEVGHLVRCEFDDDTLNSGKFFTAGPKEEAEEAEDTEEQWLEEGDEDSLLFDFDFNDLDGGAKPSGMVLSSGIWRSATTKSGWYNFMFYGSNSFVLNVVPHDSEGSAFIIRGVKVSETKARVEQPWYSRMMLPLSMFMLFRRFFGGEAAAAPAAAGAAAPADKKSKSRRMSESVAVCCKWCKSVQ